MGQQKTVIPFQPISFPTRKNKVTNLQHILWQKEREIEFLKAEQKRLQADLRFKNSLIDEWVDYLECGLQHSEWDSYGQFLRRVQRLRNSKEGR